MKYLKLLSICFALTSTMSFAQVNINTANLDELSALKSIGEKKAKAIIKYRAKNGKFKSKSDLTNIKGISEKIVSDLGSDIKTSGSSDVTKLKGSTKKSKATKKIKSSASKAKKTKALKGESKKKLSKTSSKKKIEKKVK